MDRSRNAGVSLTRRQALAAGAALASTCLFPGAAAAEVTNEVVTSAGRVRGYRAGGVHVFKGLPYAAPPVRFRPPAPVQPWNGVRAAVQWPAECPQHNPPAGGETGELFRIDGDAGTPQSEDCLALNIWTPAPGHDGGRPVMVWLHGGGFAVGSGSSELYDGTRLCNRGDVVVVTLNHRLNLFGYLYLGGLGLGGDYADAGNAGMLDIVEALRWIRRNIAAFGGDPGNVTIFGQSGGGAKVSTLMAMPSARGLFHRAIIQSGPGVRAIEPQAASEVTHEILRRLNLSSREAGRLLTLPSAALVDVLAMGGGDGMGLLRLGPVVDARSLAAHPFDPVAPAVSADVPLLIGCTSEEVTSVFGSGDPAMFTLSDADLPGRVARIAGSLSPEVIAEYRQRHPEATPSQLYIRIFSDHVMRRGTLEIAERRSAARRAPTYVYWFRKGSPRFGGKFGAAHGMDLPYVFDNLRVARSLVGDDPSTDALAATCSSAWTAFARHGVPGAPALPAWRPYTSEDRATMILDDRCDLVVDPEPAARGALARVPPWVF